MSEIKASGEEYYKSVKEEEKNEKRHIPRFIQKIVAWGFFIGIWTAIYLIVYGVVTVLLEDNDINLFTSFHAGILILVFFLVVLFYYSLILIIRNTLKMSSKYFEQKEREYYEVFKENLITEQDKDTLFKGYLKDLKFIESLALPLVYLITVFFLLLVFFMIFLMYLLAFALSYPPNIEGLSNNIMQLFWLPGLTGLVWVILYILFKFMEKTTPDSLIKRKLKTQERSLKRLEKKYGGK